MGKGPSLASPFRCKDHVSLHPVSNSIQDKITFWEKEGTGGDRRGQEHEGGTCVSGRDPQGAKTAGSTDDFRKPTAAFTSSSVAEPAWL